MLVWCLVFINVMYTTLFILDKQVEDVHLALGIDGEVCGGSWFLWKLLPVFDRPLRKLRL